MITDIIIENYKSVEKVSLSLGRINVFIGENGAGKSNILEAIALASAASANKLDNEFLISRGVRVSDSSSITPTFSQQRQKIKTSITIKTDDSKNIRHVISTIESPYTTWKYLTEVLDESGTKKPKTDFEKFVSLFNDFMNSNEYTSDTKKKNITELMRVIDSSLKSAESRKFEVEVEGELADFIMRSNNSAELSSFIIYSPELSSLKNFSKEGQILPLGINGEGTFKLIEILTSQKTIGNKFSAELNKFLELFGWFESFKIKKTNVENLSQPYTINIKDKYLKRGTLLDQNSINEGFLFALFYFSLFSTELTPKFFAIDNIDTSLNPKMCAKLIEQITALSIANKKQAILTTHNPAVLDGLNLDDEQQRLFVIYRSDNGRTKIRRIKKTTSAKPIKLSEAFLRGSLGGLPECF